VSAPPRPAPVPTPTHPSRHPLYPQELMYLMIIKRLKDGGLTIVTDLGDAAPTGLSSLTRGAAGGDPAATGDAGRDTMGRRMEQLMPLVSLPVADSILGYVGTTVTKSMRLLAKDTPLSIDRVQAARLYAGMLEVRGAGWLAAGRWLALCAHLSALGPPSP
jgi:hypothetical protein